MIDVDPNTPLGQVRLNIGDTSQPYLISDDILNYLLTENNDDVDAASLKAIQYIIRTLTKAVDQEVGDVRVSFSQMLANYKQLEKDIKKSQLTALHILGGTTRSEIERVKRSPESVGLFQRGFFSDVCDSDFDPDNPFFLR